MHGCGCGDEHGHEAEMTPPKMTHKVDTIALTPSAATKVKELLNREKAADKGLRISVMPGGCSGLMYSLNFDKARDKGDVSVDSHGVKLFVDEQSLTKLKGTLIDFVDSLTGSGFTFANPNATSSCGCGESFH